MKTYTDVNEKLGFSRRYADWTILQVLEKEPDFISFCLNSVKKFKITKPVRYAHESHMLRIQAGATPVVQNAVDSIQAGVRWIAEQENIPVENISMTGTLVSVTTPNGVIKFQRKTQWWIAELKDLILTKYETINNKNS